MSSARQPLQSLRGSQQRRRRATGSRSWSVPVAILLLLFILAALSLALPAYAQGFEPEVVGNEALVDFPHSVTFRLELADPAEISSAALVFQLGRSSCLDAGTEVPVEIDGPVLEWNWVLSRSGNPPPGAQLWWQWELSDAAGNIFLIERRELTFVDERFDWQTMEAGGNGGPTIRLHWYRDREAASTLLEAAVAGLGRLQDDMGITVQGDIQLFIYADSADMRQALLYVQDWAGAVAFSDYNLVLAGVPAFLADTWGSETVRHELAHLAIGQFGRSCLGGGRPTWLDEGLATYAEGEPNEEIQQDIDAGIADNSFEPVRSLNGAFPSHDDQASAAYSQSYSLVAYLLETYGQDKMKELLQAMADAQPYDEALQAVYGFNADGLEAAWREAIGAPPRQIPPTPTPIVAALVPTVRPVDGVQDWPTPASLDPGPAEPTESTEPSPGICGFALAPLVLAAAFLRRSGVAPSRRTRDEREDD